MVNSVSVQGGLIASGSVDKSAQVSNMQTRTKLWQFQHKDKVWCVQLHEDWLITCGNDKSTKIWDLGDGKKLHELEQSSPCWNFDISSNKSLLAIASEYELVLLDFSKITEIKKFVLGTHENELEDMRFNQSGTKLVAGLHEGEVFKIDLIFDS